MPVRIESKAEPIPGYRLLERLGGGGFGEVWKAEAPGGLHKAIKFVYGDLQTAGDDGQRAEQELKALSRVKTVRHPYILSLERYDIIDGQLLIVMELADRNLWDRYKECRQQGLPGIPRSELLGYMAETAEALDLMNTEHQLQHLDIKPHNLFLVHNHIKVADFGLVKDLEGMVASVTGGVTPVYAAPETFDGYVSRYCDQYSLAIVYQELLTGTRPFSGTNVRQLILQHLQGTPNLASLPDGDREAVARALAKRPEDRHPSCQNLINALRGEGRPSEVRKPPADTDDTGFHAGRTDTQPIEAIPQAAAQMPQSEAVPAEDPEAFPIADSLLANGSFHQATRLIRAPDGVPGSAGAEARPRPGHESAPDTGLLEPCQGGVLRPALVLGLGQYGLRALRQLREDLAGRLCPLEELPHLRLLYLDTDLAAVRGAARGTDGTPLGSGEAMLVRLNRPSHYLKPRDTHVRLDGWFDAQMLYRIPRTQLTAGLRALGRLAFCDNHAVIVRRLQEALELCAAPDALAAAARQTGLGLRSRRPRVYLVTSLAGGTGGGMFLDLAYVVRSVLRKLGHGEPEVIGVFLLPAADRNPARTLALGNTFASLTELRHFASTGQAFWARYADKEAPLHDPAPPFSRCVMLPLPDEEDEAAAGALAGRVSDFLYRELLTPLGPEADRLRAQAAPLRLAGGPYCQTFGMYRFTFPRRALVRQAARRLCRQLVERWLTKDAQPVREPVQQWVQEQWLGQELGVEHFIGHLQDACAQAIGQAPESAFEAALGLLASVSSGDDSGKGLPRRGRSGQRTAAPPAPEVSVESLVDALRQLEALVGQPEQDTLQQPPALVQALAVSVSRLVGHWGQKLSELVVRLIEEPEYRLAGAEEAARQIVSRIENVLQHHEPLAKELATKAAEAHYRIYALLQALQGGQAVKNRAAVVADVVELLRAYPKWRYQGLVLQHVAGAYVSLRGNLSDQLREINFCRVRLGELLGAFSEAGTELAQPADDTARHLFPGACPTLEEALARFLESISPADLHEVDRQVQEMITHQFRALVHVCLTSANILKDVQTAMEDEVGLHVERRLGPADVAELFRQQYSDGAEATNAIATAFDEAAPDLSGIKSGGHRTETCFVVAPDGPAGAAFLDLAARALGDVVLNPVAGGDDLVFYREMAQLAIVELEQLGAAGYEAYRQMSAVEHFTPHTRTDICFRPWSARS